jgi:GH24 family phage-related lysozyme (muramidase)
MLPSIAAAQALPFIVAANRQSASAAQIQADYQAVRAVRGVHAATYYAPHTRCILTATDIDMLFARRVNEFKRQLRGLYTDFDNFPDSAQLAILDIAFNIGVGALTRNWPSFNTAVNSGNWTVAAAQSSRRGIQPARNTSTNTLLQDAAQEAAAAAGADAGVP